MTTEQTEAPEWGAPTPPPPDRKKWTAKRTIVAVAIAVGIAGAGGAAIYAASGSVTGQGPGGGQGGMVIGGPMGSMEGVAHGAFQTGEVTEVSDTSITAKSEDGYTETYTIDDKTVKSSEVAKGDKVTVIANADGVAASIMKEGEMMQRRGGGGAPPNGGPPDGNGGPRNGN